MKHWTTLAGILLISISFLHSQGRVFLGVQSSAGLNQLQLESDGLGDPIRLSRSFSGGGEFAAGVQLSRFWALKAQMGLSHQQYEYQIFREATPQSVSFSNRSRSFLRIHPSLNAVFSLPIHTPSNLFVDILAGAGMMFTPDPNFTPCNQSLSMFPEEEDIETTATYEISEFQARSSRPYAQTGIFIRKDFSDSDLPLRFHLGLMVRQTGGNLDSERGYQYEDLISRDNPQANWNFNWPDCEDAAIPTGASTFSINNTGRSLLFQVGIDKFFW